MKQIVSVQVRRNGGGYHPMILCRDKKGLLLRSVAVERGGDGQHLRRLSRDEAIKWLNQEKARAGGAELLKIQNALNEI